MPTMGLNYCQVLQEPMQLNQEQKSTEEKKEERLLWVASNKDW